MKPLELILLFLLMIVGTYLNRLDPERSNQIAIEDSIKTPKK